MKRIAYWLYPVLFLTGVSLWLIELLVPATGGKVTGMISLVHMVLPLSLTPPILGQFLPISVQIALGFVMLALVARRIWLFVKRKQGMPVEFAGFPQVLAYIGFLSLGAGVLGLMLVFAVGGVSAVPAAMLMTPATLCCPWAFFLTEIRTLRRKRSAAPVPS